eukprot:CAMPEP_0175269404 /NCGR_PEP_ID=MMETSP0093-20121207/44842_1 /TAXON_ID=311494 /ORGANISM="Alexandrium monilatum, Strain CCMP3105" /LENGTH=70 /DNA_ID=CAMNT_0016564061 /DNA_START=77 /DNA_END=285 /DNA_ORIENTATION=-
MAAPRRALLPALLLAAAAAVALWLIADAPAAFVAPASPRAVSRIALQAEGDAPKPKPKKAKKAWVGPKKG